MQMLQHSNMSTITDFQSVRSILCRVAELMDTLKQVMLECANGPTFKATGYGFEYRLPSDMASGMSDAMDMCVHMARDLHDARIVFHDKTLMYDAYMARFIDLRMQYKGSVLVLVPQRLPDESVACRDMFSLAYSTLLYVAEHAVFEDSALERLLKRMWLIDGETIVGYPSTHTEYCKE